MMQMLAAGGLPLLTDYERKPDVDNPRGYCEWEAIKQLPKNPELIAQAEGKAVKVITQLLLSLPPGHDYKLIFMERPLPEVLASQDEMLKRRGGTTPPVDSTLLHEAFRNHLKEVSAWLEQHGEIPLLRVGYRRLIKDPLDHASEVREFLNMELKVDEMAAQVDPTLYRNRR